MQDVGIAEAKLIYRYVIVISRYEHDIQVIAQDQGETEVVGDDLDIMRVNRDITNFYPMQIDINIYLYIS